MAFVVFQSGLNLVFRNFIEKIYRKGSVLDDRAFRFFFDDYPGLNVVEDRASGCWEDTTCRPPKP